MSKQEQEDCYKKYFVLQAQALTFGTTHYSDCATRKVGQGCALKEPATQKPTASPTKEPTKQPTKQPDAGGCTSKDPSIANSWCQTNCNAGYCPANICSCNN